MQLRRYFCWTRMGIEAGESLDGIIQRKEAARAADHGTFLWGIGNRVTVMQELVSRDPHPVAVFTAMKSPAQAHDVSPSAVVLWRGAASLTGEPIAMPPHSVVTSRENDRRRHYALVCRSDLPIDEPPDPPLTFTMDQVRNLVSGKPVAGQQNTAIVEYTADEPSRRLPYVVRFMAGLVPPYIVELADPVIVPPDVRQRVADGDVTVLQESFDW